MPHPRAISIGNFDGVHRGHIKLVTTARAAVGDGGSVVILAFDPHPLSVLRPEDAPARLTTFAQRADGLHAAGADEIIRLEPDGVLLATSPRTFIEEIVRLYEPQFIVEGPDFRFGQGRSGTVETLREVEASFGYRTLIIEPVTAMLGDRHLAEVSSTLVRWLIRRGRLGDARRLLGHHHELVGVVVSGDRRGRTIGVPTANLDVGDLLLPADGIYYGRGWRGDGSSYPAAISVGTKPTFGDHPRTCEAHLVGYEGPVDEYGWTLRLQVFDWLRDQIRYDDVAALVTQLGRDIARTETLCGLEV